MRHLVLLALMALVAFPLSAHGHHGRGPRRVMVEDSYGRRHDRRYDHDGDRVVLRPLPPPLAPPFQGRVELRLH